MKKKSLIALVLFVALFAGAAVAYIALKPTAAEGDKTIIVQVEHLRGAPATYVFETDAQYLREALEEQELIAGEESEYGLWVQTVDGETADEDNQEWWGYSVNGQYAEYGVDAQPVANGDVYEFVLHEGW